jgi:hypothetical protein
MINVKWKFGILVGIISIFFGLYPQIDLWQKRGDDFQGTFASNDLDEIAYAAYLQALIDGRPRKNDPYSGRDESADTPQPESIFSIQFLPPLVLSIPARIVGANASQMFIATSAIFIFLTALAMFWLISLITGNEIYAAVGTLMMISFGALVSGLGAIGYLTGGAAYPYLPFLRRYIPAVAFPFFFGLFASVWIVIKSEIPREKIIFAIIGGLCFAFLVFSYFYLWTTAAAFLFLFTLIFLILRPENWKREFPYLILLGGIALLSLLPYAFLISNRAEATDAIQLLVYSRAPDLFRVPSIVCYVCLVFLGVGIALGFAKLKHLSTIFLISFALVPFAVFNQQIITGRSLQPFHYQYYVANYIVAAVVVLTIYIFLKEIKSAKIFNAIAAVLLICAIGWGYFEVTKTTELLSYWNIEREKSALVSKRLNEISGENIDEAKHDLTINFDYIQADTQPVIAPQAVLWARHQHVFAGVGWEENKERFYQLMYYAGRDADWMRENFRRGDIEAYMALFGWDRFNANLSVNYRPLTKGEVEAEVQRYKVYIENFSAEQAKLFPLKFAVAKLDNQPDYENLDKWYRRDSGEVFGEFILYKLTPKN